MEALAATTALLARTDQLLPRRRRRATLAPQPSSCAATARSRCGSGRRQPRLTLTSISTHTVTVTTSEAQERARSARKDNDGPRRRELLRAASACFAELGYDRTTVEVITTRAEVSRATFYAYFSSKDEVFHAVAADVCEEFLESQHVEGPASEDLREVLRTTTKAFVEAVYADGRVLELIRHRARLDPEVGRSWSTVQTRLVRLHPVHRTHQRHLRRHAVRAARPHRADPRRRPTRGRRPAGRRDGPRTTPVHRRPDRHLRKTHRLRLATTIRTESGVRYAHFAFE